MGSGFEMMAIVAVCGLLGVLSGIGFGWLVWGMRCEEMSDELVMRRNQVQFQFQELQKVHDEMARSVTPCND